MTACTTMFRGPGREQPSQSVPVDGFPPTRASIYVEDGHLWIDVERSGSWGIETKLTGLR